MNEPENKWPVYKKIEFLFLFFYFLLFGTSVQFLVNFATDPLWENVIPWFAQLVGHPTPITIFPNGSGDTTFNYYQILFFFILACLLAVSTSLILKNKWYSVLSKWLAVFLRYYIAIQMINYGLAKLYYLQFAFPSFNKLDQPLGEFSPMGLLWAFMGFSQGYTMFTGALELIGGLLLLTKRTSTLGALIVFGVMVNVMMLNLFYDVPVKILSSHIVLMSLYLILSDSGRLIRFFIFNQSVPPLKIKEVLPLKYVKTKNITKWLLVVSFLVFSNFEMYRFKSDYENSIAATPFYGRSTIESFKIWSDDGEVDSTAEKWQTLYQSWPGYATVKTTNGYKLDYIFEVDTTTKQVKYKQRGSSDFAYLEYKKIDPDRFHLYGSLLQDSVDMVINTTAPEDYELVNRGFHWINEYPFSK